MPRRAKIIRKRASPDPKYGSLVVAKFINRIMCEGKKATAESIVYDALDTVKEKLNTEPMEVLDQAL